MSKPKLKVGDKVVCYQYFQNYEDTEPMCDEDLEEMDYNIFTLIKYKIPLIITHIASMKKSPYQCKNEENGSYEFFEERELKLIKIESWRDKICSDNTQ